MESKNQKKSLASRTRLYVEGQTINQVVIKFNYCFPITSNGWKLQNFVILDAYASSFWTCAMQFMTNKLSKAFKNIKELFGSLKTKPQPRHDHILHLFRMSSIFLSSAVSTQDYSVYGITSNETTFSSTQYYKLRPRKKIVSHHFFNWDGHPASFCLPYTFSWYFWFFKCFFSLIFLIF